jgi:hypothetical protein
MALKHITTRFDVAPYLELVDRFGMKPRYHLSQIDDRTWILTSPGTGLVHLSKEEALEVMTVDALLWLRQELGVEFSRADVAAKSPARLLRTVRDTARTLLG